MKHFIASNRISPIPIQYYLVAALAVFIGALPQTANADHINFREKDMRPIIVGETRQGLKFYGCQDKQATIELSTLIDSAPWTIAKIMGTEAGRAKFGGDLNCNEHFLKSAVVTELLYLTDQTHGEDKVDQNDSVYFGTRYSSILKIIDDTGSAYFMLANQLIHGSPSEQNEICMHVLRPICP